MLFNNLIDRELEHVKLCLIFVKILCTSQKGVEFPIEWFQEDIFALERALIMVCAGSLLPIGNAVGTPNVVTVRALDRFENSFEADSTLEFSHQRLNFS